MVIPGLAGSSLHLIPEFNEGSHLHIPNQNLLNIQFDTAQRQKQQHWNRNRNRNRNRSETRARLSPQRDGSKLSETLCLSFQNWTK